MTETDITSAQVHASPHDPDDAATAPAPTWLVVLAIAAIVVGAVLRFYNLGGKPWWQDEAWTGTHVAGYRLVEATNGIANGKVITPEELRKFQQLSPDRSMFNTVFALALDDPKHPPLFYASAHLWARVVGDSPAALRGLAALCSLLAVPALYWVCVELFRSRVAAWTGAALMAISPFQIIYAHEAREYSLWTLTTLLSTAALLRALRLDTAGAWRLYALTAAAALYTMPFSALLMLAHAIYVFAQTRGGTPRRPFRRFFIAACVAAATFAPWAIVTYLRRRVTMGSASWLMNDLGIAHLLQRWTGGISSQFADFSPTLTGWTAPEQIVGVTLAVVAIIVTCCVWRRHVGILVMLMFIPAMALVIPDLVQGGQRSAPPRYWIPTFVGIQLAVVGVIAIPLASVTFRTIQRALLLALIAAGVVSGVLIVRAPMWWMKGDRRDSNEMARLISRCERPLIIGDVRKTGLGNVLGFSHRLESNVRLFLLQRIDLPLVVPGGLDGYSDIFVFDAEGDFQSILQTRDGWKLVLISPMKGFWRVLPPIPVTTTTTTTTTDPSDTGHSPP